ncbi:hypothetical protein H0H93_011504 [Arthromyces matolae]|nr:hypothetical protein H0H93_011504 [Arthromyces matolae]
MELPLPSDRNGCDRLANWLNALHNYIDATNPSNPRKRNNLQTRLYQLRQRLREEFGFTVQSFGKRNTLATHEVIPSELTPPFSGGQTEHLAAGEKNAAPSSSANPHISPHGDLLDQPGDRPTDPASNSVDISPTAAPIQPDSIHNPSQLGKWNGSETTSVSPSQLTPGGSGWHFLSGFKKNLLGASMQHNSDRPASANQYDPEILVDPELMDEEDQWNKYFTFDR